MPKKLQEGARCNGEGPLLCPVFGLTFLNKRLIPEITSKTFLSYCFPFPGKFQGFFMVCLLQMNGCGCVKKLFAQVFIA